MRKSIFALIFMMSFGVLSAEIPTAKAILRGVDKVTGRVSTMSASVGSQINFGALTISVEKCYTRPPEETPENSAFLVVTEKMADNSVKEVFTGWMFSSNPALSAMEHPVYDVWVIGCKNDDIPPMKTLSETISDEEPVIPSDPARGDDDSTVSLDAED